MNCISRFELSAYTENTLMEIKPMNVLIANIGTSDLSVKIEESYVPLLFLRESGLEMAEAEIADANESVIWHERESFINDFCEQELSINFGENKPKNIKFFFREVTKRILEKYKENIALWHKRLQLGRILDVIETAKKFNVQKVHFFITNQPSTIKDFRGEIKRNDNSSDSVYLFEIFKLWLKEESYLNNIELLSYDVTQNNVIAVDFDGLLDRYYQFFLEQSQEKIDKLFISVKGGTPQMQSALRIQATASDITNQIYLDPQLSIKNLLSGKHSECNIVSYWRYQRIQKYQTIKKLLDRWDFDGAQKILQDWQEYLDFLKDYLIPDIQEALKAKKILNLAVNGLTIAKSVFNCDLEGSQKIANANKNLGKLGWVKLSGEKQYNSVLNLYTQCRIFWELGQVANFLPRFGSFYEEVLHQLFIGLDSDRYFDEKEKPRWSLLTKHFKGTDNKDKALLLLFTDRERKLKHKIYKHRSKGKNDFKFNTWQSFHTLGGRFSKRNFAEALVLYRKPKKEKVWQEIQNSFDKLDYWFGKRNAITHGAKGISRDRLDEILTEDRKKYLPDADPLQADPNEACWGNEILDEMGKIYRNVEIILDRIPCSFVDRNAPEYNKAPYYIYSEAKEWVIETLNRDR